jgi:anti-anti-sigma factor
VSELIIERGPLLSTPARTLRCRGELDAHTLDQLETELALAFTEGVLHILVDMREVSYCSSRGIGILVRGRKEAVDVGGGLVLLSPAPTVATALEVLGFDDVFDIVQSEGEAVEVLGLR